LQNIYGVIDVGTNNVLLLIASVTDQINVIERGSRISALGNEMNDGWLDVKAVKRTKLILADFIEQAHKYTENVIIVGTSCSRDAKNISLLSEWLAEKYQIQYHIITGNEEAQFNGLANINEFKNHQNIIMFDVGGGSTEFIWIENARIIQSQSIDLGIRRLQNQFGSNVQQKNDETKKLLATLDSPPFKSDNVVGIGGTATSLSAMKFKLDQYDPEVVHKSKVTRTELNNVLIDLHGKTEIQIQKLMPFEPKRADLIETGTMIVTEILDYFEVEEFFVSDRGIQFGILEQDKLDLEKMLSKG